MFSEEETELRDLIIQSLENSGFLNRIKAELRAGVFLAIEEDGKSLRNKIPLFNKTFDDFAGTAEGKIMLSLVRDFLEYFNLQFTLSVFDPEIALNSPCMTRTEICKQLKLNSDIGGPVISELVKDKLDDHILNSTAKFAEELKLEDNETSKSIPESIPSENTHTEAESNSLGKKSIDNISNFEKLIKNDKKELIIEPEISSKSSTDNIFKDTIDTNIVNNNSDMLKSPTDILSPDHDPFFDEPLPSEKTSFFSFAEALKDKPESKLSSDPKSNLDESKKSILSSLKDLPCLTTSNEWTFSRDPKSTLSSLESQKSVSSSETSNEEIINLDSKESFQKKESDIAESNEESSEKPNSEESIEEEIEEEDFSAGFEDLLNSSLSLGDDVTTDQTVSQTSIVEGVDHVEPCK